MKNSDELDNDGLRGLSLKAMQENLIEMIEKSQQRNVKVVLVGMQLPPNYGPHYNSRFYATYRELSTNYNTALLPFLLEGVGENKALFQNDGLHPKAKAQPIIMQNIWQVLKPLLSDKT